ncbi:MAG: mammalian cell entry protein [Frankiales bacterium]|nr:mammalian cell entry protein [Frankiales bacterium]
MSKLRLRLTGVAFLAVIAGLVGLTVLLYQKAFTPVVEVTLKADHVGNQLTAPADVKIRGLIVGSVREVSSTGDGATLRLALQPDKVHLIPRDVSARLLPKTLFGEKFVDLVTPDRTTGRSIRAGDVIGQDHSSTALETEKVLNDLIPLLQALKPQQLSETLNAVAGALRGRGERTGANLEALDTYLSRLNPEMPTIQKDVRGLAALSETYDKAAPDLLAVLDNFSAVSRNLADQQQQLSTFLDTTTRSTGTLDDVLSENERRLVQLASSSRPSLALLARYSSEFPCLAQGLADYEPTVSSTFGGKQPGLHITLEQTQDQNGYVKGDEPAFKDDRSAYCNGLPSPPVPQGNTDFQDGYRDTASSSSSSGAAARTATNDPALFLSGAADPAAADRDVLASVTAPVLGVSMDAVPDLVDLLFGPMARGTKVGLA